MVINNLILVKGREYWEVRDHLLEGWLYTQVDQNELDKDTTFALYKLEDDLSAIKINGEFDKSLFFSLITYCMLTYLPEYRPKVIGYNTLEADEDMSFNMMFYFLEEDADLLRIYGVMEQTNRTCRIDFLADSSITDVDSDMTYQYPDVDLSSPTEIIPVPQPKQKPVKVKRKKSEYERGDTGNKTITFLVCLLVVLLGLLFYLVMLS